MTSPPASYRFGPFVLDAVSYRLVKDGAPIDLPPKALDLLFLFARRPGALVTKDDMLAALWPGLAVTDNALTQVASDLRQALGDRPSSPQYIETVPRRGYRFVGAIDVIAPTGRPDAPREAAEVSVPSGGVPRVVSVADFTNVTGDADIAWLGAGIADTVTNDLRAIRVLRVMDRDWMARAGEGRIFVDIVVTGSFQRVGDRLRITAQAVDARSQTTLARAKADGALDDVFQMQDAIVTELTSSLELTITPKAAARITARETSSLEAYRRLTEGRLKLETLAMADVPGAVEDFESAIRLDPRYALAHVGLAHASFWRFQASRAQSRPDRDALSTAMRLARRAVEIDPELAEGHAALALFLASADRRREAVVAGRLAVSLEPGNWRHQFRLGIAAWGEERIAALGTVAVEFPGLAYAAMGLAMVHVARGQFAEAEAVVRRGLAAERPATERRFPGRGLNFLLGLLRLAAGDLDAARSEFGTELVAPPGSMFGDEYAVDAGNGLGFAALAAGDGRVAADHFDRALQRQREHPRSLLGLSAALERQGYRDRAIELRVRSERAIEGLAASGREIESVMMRAEWLVESGRPSDAIEALAGLLDSAAPGPAGWSIPIEPLLAGLRGEPAFHAVLRRLADRAG